MEALPTDWMYSFLSDIEGKPLSPVFEELGFEHHMMLNNYGTLGFVFLSMPLAYIIHCFSSSCSNIKCCIRFSRSFGRKIYWGIMLRMIIEGYVIGLLSCLINARSLDFTQE